MKIITRKFSILNSKSFQVIYPKACEMFVYKHTEIIEYIKISVFFKKNNKFTGE